MLSLRKFWTRNKRKVYVTVGVLGSGYVLYKLYAAHKQKLDDLDKELAREREADELIKSQLQAHFENIQSIVDSTTLPYAMYYLRNRISEELDLSYLTNRLNQVKGQGSTLTSSEKLELWENLKILSFTKMVLSLWATTTLNLYIRIQVNILGRHLYIDTARGMESSYILEEANQFDIHGQQEFLATADYLSNHGMAKLLPNMRAAATEVLKGKQLTDRINAPILHDTIMQILNVFMTTGDLHQWVTYLVPERTNNSLFSYPKDFDETLLLPDISKLDQLILEARSVLMSVEFGRVMEISLKSVVDALMDEVGSNSGGIPETGVPLARLLARVAQMGPLLVEEPSKNRFIQTIQSLPEVELFYTLLYANSQLQYEENT
ncbi:hypothetical protein ACHQM5_005654 [Ranunculus cassubicifolius]